jgi:serine phosphatase RsbU (regulator of sigma subunit)
VNYKELFRKVEGTLARIERSEDLPITITMILKSLVDDYRDELGISGGRVYRQRGKGYVLTAQHGSGPKLKPGFRIPFTYAPIRLLRKRGYIYMGPDDPGFDPRLEQKIGVKRFAAIGIGEDSPWIIAFTLSRKVDPDHLRISLSTIRHAVNLKLRQEALEDIILEAKKIQLSLLPREIPKFADFEMWGHSRPAEEVGGDLYDFLPISPRLLGVAIGDSSGHGLPSALQARDVITGLRVVVEEDFKIIKGIEKLNRVISRGSLSSRFISLFYGEIEPGGAFLYLNAGHPPPVFVRDGSVKYLTKGGMILGPNPDAKYERGYVFFRRGSFLVLYSDGITEARRAGSEELLGVKRLASLAKELAGKSAKEIGEAVFEHAERWSGGAPLQDDRTVVVLRRP